MKKRSFALIALFALGAPAASVLAEVDSDYISSRSNTTVRTVRWPSSSSMDSSVSILKNTSQVFRFDRSILRAAVSNPEICDITTVGENDILVNAKEAGFTNLLVWDANNDIATFRIESTLDITRLKGLLIGIDPQADLQIVPFNKSLAVYGTTDTSLKLKQMEDTVKAFDPSVLIFVKLRESKQVLLEVRFAEVNRTNNKEFKFDFYAYHRMWAVGSFIGKTGFSARDASSLDPYTPNGSVVGYELPKQGDQNVATLSPSYFSGGFGMPMFLKWLEEKNIIRLIARPNLVAKDGQEASFIVGGEFPIPVSNNNSISIIYKEFGTQLKFTPEVLDDRKIRLTLDSMVSELNTTNTVTVGGFSLPTILKRQYKTVSELQDEDSLVIGGLITQKVNQTKRKVPLLGDIPLLKTFFNSSDFTQTDVELIVVVTPHIVHPFNLEQKKKLYDAQEAKDAVRIFVPPYPDPQADKIVGMLAEGEPMRDLKGEEEEAEQLLRSVSAAKMKEKEKEPRTLAATNFTPKSRQSYPTKPTA